MRRTAEDAAETRARVLASAIEVFTAEGYGLASAERIALAAGVTRGALYHHFKHKRDLFIAAFDKLNEEFEDFVAEQAERQPDERAALLAIANAWLVFPSRPSYQAIAVRDAALVFGEAGVEPTNRSPGSRRVRDILGSMHANGQLAINPESHLLVALMGALKELGAEYARAAQGGAANKKRSIAAFASIIDGLMSTGTAHAGATHTGVFPSSATETGAKSVVPLNAAKRRARTK